MPISLFDRRGCLQSSAVSEQIRRIQTYKIEPAMRRRSGVSLTNKSGLMGRAQYRRWGRNFNQREQKRILPLIANVVLAVIFGFCLAACKKEPSPPISSTGERIQNPQILNVGDATQKKTRPSRDSDEVEAKKNAKDSGVTGEDHLAEAEQRAEQPSLVEANYPHQAGVKSEANKGHRTEIEDATDQEIASKSDGSKSEYRVLILGDSLAATGFGVILEKRLDVHPKIRCVRKAKSASGLARPDFFDWINESKRQVRLQSPDLVVVIIGGNDGQDLLEKRGRKRRVGWKSQDWDKNYQARVEKLLKPAVDAGARILWLGLPRTDTKNFEAKLEIIRQSQREVIDNMGDVATYLDTTPLLSRADGSPLKMIKQGKRRRRLRVDDGIHFTMAGSQYFADKVYPEIVKLLNLEPVP